MLGRSASLHQGRPDEATQLTGDGGDHLLIRFSPRPQPVVTTMRARLSSNTAAVRPAISGLAREESSPIVFDGAQSRDRFIDGTELRGVGLVKRRQRPLLRTEPGVRAPSTTLSPCRGSDARAAIKTSTGDAGRAGDPRGCPRDSGADRGAIL